MNIDPQNKDFTVQKFNIKKNVLLYKINRLNYLCETSDVCLKLPKSKFGPNDWSYYVTAYIKCIGMHV